MNQLQIRRDGVDKGTYSFDEAQGLIASKQLLGSDLAWHDGLTAWAPLHSLAEFKNIFSPQPVPAASAQAPGLAAPAGGVVATGFGNLAGRDVRLVAFFIDLALYVALGIIAGYFNIWLGAMLWLLVVAVQAILLVKRGQTLGKLLQGIKIADYRTNDRTGLVRVLLVRSGIPLLIAELPRLLVLVSSFLILIGALESNGLGVAGGLAGLGAAGLLSTFGSLFLLVDILFIYSGDRRCLHDRMAGTVVIKTRERTLEDKIIYWLVIAVLLAFIVGGAAKIGNGAMSI